MITINYRGKKGMDEKDLKATRDFYESVNNVWPVNNPWHDVSQKEIREEISKLSIQVNNIKVLNAGSGGNDYNLKCNMYNIDVVAGVNSSLPNFTLGSIEQMPYDNCFFDIIICVGSVINYCDAAKSISEFSRVLKSNGLLILEFESSYGYEYLHTDAYMKNVAKVTCQYLGKEHRLWVYSPKYISNLLKCNNFCIRKQNQFHILSSYMYSKRKDENKSAKFAKYDVFLKHIPYIKNHSSNIIYKCQKQ